MIVRVNESQKVEITSCRSSVTINSTIKGDGTHGGLIGVSRNDRSAVDIVIANSLFDGKLIGKETDSWGGFVGWTYWGARVNIRNCFFNPQAVDINQNGSYTLFRSSYNGSNNIVNTYASTFLNRQQGINAESKGRLLWFQQSASSECSFLAKAVLNAMQKPAGGRSTDVFQRRRRRIRIRPAECASPLHRRCTWKRTPPSLALDAS